MGGDIPLARAPTQTRKGNQMETLDNKRARLRGELQHGYSAWLSASETGDDTARFPIDTSGCAQHSKVRWFDYLAAKERLVAAYAEQRPIS
jgi:hypothetical protein